VEQDAAGLVASEKNSPPIRELILVIFRIAYRLNDNYAERPTIHHESRLREA
jgi:hypothetical protein